jgi:predicted dehydrogenase
VTLALGLIGCGAISESHLRAFREQPGVRLAACADLCRERAEERARQFEIPRVFADPADLLEEDLDLVVICVPPRWHPPLFTEALRRGRHVLVEKPLAADLPGADAMLEAADSSARIAAVPLVHRYTPAYHAARELVRAGAVGQVRLARLSTGRGMYGDSRFTRPEADPRGWLVDAGVAGGGMLMSSTIHFLSVMQFALGDPAVTRVTARVRRLHPRAFPGIEDETDLWLDLAGGAEVVLRESWVTDAPYRAEIAGDRGHLVLEGEAWSELSLAGLCEGTLPESYRCCLRGTEFRASHEELAHLCKPLFHGLAADLVESIRRGEKSETLPDVRHARNMQAVIAAAYESAAEARAVPVPWRAAR